MAAAVTSAAPVTLVAKAWRHVSVLDGLCFSSVRGRGPDGYREGLALLREHLEGGTR